MAYTEFGKEMGIISALPDEPNDTGGLTAAALKAKFDEGGIAIKEYINNTLLKELPQISDITSTFELGVPSCSEVNNAITRAGNFPAGGAANQMLIKASGANYDTMWATPDISALNNDSKFIALTDLCDYVTETGSAPDLSAYTYRKWNSGVYECWASASPGAVGVTTAAGGIFRSGNQTVPLPEALTAVSSLNILPYDANHYFWAALVGIDLGLTAAAHKNQFVFGLFSPTSITTDAGMKICVYAKGKWK